MSHVVLLDPVRASGGPLGQGRRLEGGVTMMLSHGPLYNSPGPRERAVKCRHRSLFYPTLDGSPPEAQDSAFCFTINAVFLGFLSSLLTAPQHRVPWLPCYAEDKSVTDHSSQPQEAAGVGVASIFHMGPWDSCWPVTFRQK